MAFVTPPINPEEQNQFAPGGLTTPNPAAMLPPQTTESGGSAGAGTVGGGAPSQGTPTQFGSNASKLSDYLAANADQTQTMGNQIAGNLTSQFGQVQGDVDKAGTDFGSQVSASYTPSNPGVVSAAAADPTKFASDPNNVAAFQGQLNDKYTGPANMESTPAYASIQKEVQGAVDNANLTGSPGGLSTYLQNSVPKGQTYTPGMNALDTVLLQGNKDANQKITDAAKPFANLTGYLSNAVANGNAAIPGAQQEAQKASDAARAAFTGPGGVIPTFKDSLNQNLTSAQGQAKSFNDRLADIKARLNNGQPLTMEESGLVDPKGTLQTLNPYGQSTGVFQNIQAEGLPGFAPGYFSNYYKDAPGPVAPPSMANVATSDDYSKSQALNALMGEDQGLVPTLGQQFKPSTNYGTFDDQGALTNMNDTLTSYLNQVPTGSEPSAGNPNEFSKNVLPSFIGLSPLGLPGAIVSHFLLGGGDTTQPTSTSVLEQLNPEQQNSWLSDIQALHSYLGMPSPYQGPGIQPVAPPQIGLGPNGGPPFLQPPDQTTGTTLTSSGGRATR